MIDDLKELEIDDMITLDSEEILNKTNREDFKITDIKILQCEDGDCVILEMDDFHLICHSLAGDEIFYLAEIEKIEEGVSEIPEEIKISCGGEDEFYSISSLEWECDSDVICEYEGESEYKIILHKTSESDIVYKGFEIEEDAIVI